MNFFRRSIVYQIIIALVLYAIAVSAAAYAGYRWYGFAEHPWYWVVIAVGVATIGGSVLFWWRFRKPFHEILVQMQALVTGHEYKRILTDRVDEIGTLAHFFNQLTRTLSRFTGTIQEGERMATELGVASRLQRDILPTRTPTIPGLVIAAKTRPAAEVGGDSFDFMTVKDRSYFYIGDATGHGVPAGIIMTIVNTLVAVYTEIAPTLVDLLAQVNRHLKRRIQKALFMSMALFSWDHAEQTLRYVGAGHEYLLFYRAKTGEIEAIACGGIALGMVPDVQTLAVEKQLAFDEGDMLALYSDGIVECRNEAGEQFGLERLKKVLVQYASQYAPEMITRKIARELGLFMGQHPPDDDMTLIIVQRAGAGSGVAVAGGAAVAVPGGDSATGDVAGDTSWRSDA